MTGSGFLRLAAGVLLVSGPATANPVAGQLAQTEVHDVRFEGNEAFPDDSLARAIVTRPTVCRGWAVFPFCVVGRDFALQRSFLSRRELANDRNRLRIWYRQRGFRDAQVDTATTLREDQRARVTFRIVEGRPVMVDSLRFVGPDSVVTGALLADLPLRAGVRLSTLEMRATRDALERRLRNAGFAHGGAYHVVRMPSEDPRRATVVFEIEPGPVSRFGAITIDSLSSLSRSTVLRTLPFEAGDLYRANQLAEGQTRLFGLGVVQSARVVADTSAWGAPVVPVNVRVTEGDVHRVRAGAGWSTAECLDVEARWASRNFLGGGRTLQLRARVSNVLARDFYEILCPQAEAGEAPFDELTWLVAADFTHPWILSTRNTLTASLFGERQSLPNVFVRQAVGLDIAGTRVLGNRTPLRVSWSPQLSRLDAADVLFCTGFLICTPEDIDLLASVNRLAPVGVSVTSNETNNILNPTDGYILLLAAEHAAGWTGSSFRYDRVLAEATWYEDVLPGGILAARLRSGWVGSGAFAETLGSPDDVGVIHPEKRFYAGGANSVRGFAQGRLGPRVLVLDDVKALQEPPSGPGCDPTEIIDLSCDPGVIEDEGVFNPRPTGGTRVLEGNLELRLRLTSSLQAVSFTDFGQVWGVQEDVDLGAVELAPGVGVRYLSPIGPLRVDLAYRFRGGTSLPVVTKQLRPTGDPSLPYVPTDELALLTTPYFYGDSDPLELLSRLQLHFSIGQAF